MDFRIIRAEQEHQRAGAYYVRIHAMAKAHGITLREEFDDKDGPRCNYILLLDDEFPVATCRWFEVDSDTAEIGRVVVLPEYRNAGLGKRVMEEAEKWIAGNGYGKIIISSREGVEGFYEKLDYRYNKEGIPHHDTFKCIYMEKELKP